MRFPQLKEGHERHERQSGQAMLVVLFLSVFRTSCLFLSHFLLMLQLIVVILRFLKEVLSICSFAVCFAASFDWSFVTF